jgi:hypothetical protein
MMKRLRFDHIAEKARGMYDNLEGPEQLIARRAFLKMVGLGEGMKDPRRRASIAEMTAAGETPEAVHAVLGRSADPQVRLVALHEPANGDGTGEI